MSNNPLHYPNKSLCKKLKEVGFPRSEKTLWESSFATEIKDRVYDISVITHRASIVFPCPSFMEMLDEFTDDAKKTILNQWTEQSEYNLLDYLATTIIIGRTTNQMEFLTKLTPGA